LNLSSYISIEFFKYSTFYVSKMIRTVHFTKQFTHIL